MPYQVKKCLGKNRKLQTHLKRRLSEVTADVKRRMRLGGLSGSD